MQDNSLLCSPWCVWLNFQVPKGLSKEDYMKYLKKVHTITSYNDLAYFWETSIFRDVKNFLVYEK
jgi:hypothetical protein